MRIIKDTIRALIPKKVKEFIAYHPSNSFGKLTFSQEGEDILLNRIFYNIDNGFFVDVGANHPFRFSNTYRLYSKGWSGINIEPNPNSIKILNTERVRDINIQLGISLESEMLEYFYYNNSTLNTFDKQVVSMRDIKPIRNELIKTEPLSVILDNYLPAGKNIELLNVDAEGFDLIVLQSNNWSKYQPNYVFVETSDKTISEVFSSELHLFLDSVGYVLISKLFKSLLYKRK